MCISEELRNEIKLHTCQKLVDKVALFKGAPASVVGSVLGCLHAEVYLPNDSVQRAGDVGECMYFIASGTVAIYSMKGVEVISSYSLGKIKKKNTLYRGAIE